MKDESRVEEERGVVRAADGLYVHVPFCLSRCPYCHFYSTVDPAFIPDWAAAVEREAVFYRSLFTRFDTIYFGGGTPSLLPTNIPGRLLEVFRRLFSIDSAAEITLEANPGDLTPESLQGFKGLGINRISLGVQSLDDRDLRFLKRRHTAAQALEAVEGIRGAGFKNLSLDLIYGIPGQTAETWQETLEKAARLQPEHLSCYELTAEPGTVLGRAVRTGGVGLPGENERRDFFLQTSSFLAARGYEHYEVSNFARGTVHYARHNQKYWDHRRYLGLGPSAHSFDGRRRWWNARTLKSYLERLGQGRLPAGGEETLTPEQRRLEVLLLGFRTRSGVALKDLSLNREREKVLTALEENGKIIRQQDRMIPTPAGFLVADRLPLFFC
ncbi:MAG: radical SAM family heme chaperone HemW [Desulfobacterota bacterium]|nr:radical SAM family heme chaperone HemW [Thermodesulfobacteriota bacterium]